MLHAISSTMIGQCIDWLMNLITFRHASYNGRLQILDIQFIHNIFIMYLNKKIYTKPNLKPI